MVTTAVLDVTGVIPDVVVVVPVVVVVVETCETAVMFTWPLLTAGTVVGAV